MKNKIVIGLLIVILMVGIATIVQADSIEDAVRSSWNGAKTDKKVNEIGGTILRHCTSYWSIDFSYNVSNYSN